MAKTIKILQGNNNANFLEVDLTGTSKNISLDSSGNLVVSNGTIDHTFWDGDIFRYEVLEAYSAGETPYTHPHKFRRLSPTGIVKKVPLKLHNVTSPLNTLRGIAVYESGELSYICSVVAGTTYKIINALTNADVFTSSAVLTGCYKVISIGNKWYFAGTNTIWVCDIDGTNFGVFKDSLTGDIFEMASFTLSSVTYIVAQNYDTTSSTLYIIDVSNTTNTWSTSWGAPVVGNIIPYRENSGSYEVLTHYRLGSGGGYIKKVSFNTSSGITTSNLDEANSFIASSYIALQGTNLWVAHQTGLTKVDLTTSAATLVLSIERSTNVTRIGSLVYVASANRVVLVWNYVYGDANKSRQVITSVNPTTLKVEYTEVLDFSYATNLYNIAWAELPKYLIIPECDMGIAAFLNNFRI